MKKSLFLVLWACIGITAMAQITLRFNPEKGTRYEYQMEMTNKIGQNIMGQQIDMNMAMKLVYSMDVLEVTADETKLEFMFTEVAYNVGSAMMNMKYDSKSNAAPANEIDKMMAEILSCLIDKKLTTVMTADGTVKSVTGMQAIIDDMMKAGAGGNMLGQQLGQQLAQQFGDEAMKDSFEQSFKIYPGKAIKPGDSWSIVQNTGSAGMNMEVNTTYRLASVTGNIANANIESTINGMDGQITGTQQGTVEFDVKTGMPRMSKISQKASGTISANGMEVPIEMTSQVNITVVPIAK